MKYLRIFADEQGESHFEDLELEMTPSTDDDAALPIRAETLVLRRTSPGRYVPWHTTHSRRFVITLAGACEITASDGQVRQFGAGSIMLADDTHGKGHTARNVGDTHRVALFIVPAEGSFVIAADRGQSSPP